MIKYYYTDPLAAAYMAREFGVQLDDDVIEKATLSEALTMVSQHINNNDVQLSAKIRVKDDSLHIFEPRRGGFNSTGKRD